MLVNTVTAYLLQQIQLLAQRNRGLSPRSPTGNRSAKPMFWENLGTRTWGFAVTRLPSPDYLEGNPYVPNTMPLRIPLHLGPTLYDFQQEQRS
jgi:hypothetical protein